MNDINTKTSVKYAADTEHTYVSIGAPKFRTRIDIDGAPVVIQFVDSMLKLDPVTAEIFDAVLHKVNSPLRQFVRKIDRALGEEISKKWQEEHAQRAVSGPFSSNHRAEMLKETLDARNINAQTPEALAEFKTQLGNSMEVQEHVAQVAHPVASKSPKPVGASTGPITQPEQGAPGKGSDGFLLKK